MANKAYKDSMHDDDDENSDYADEYGYFEESEAIKNAAEKITNIILDKRAKTPALKTLFVNIGETSAIAAHSITKQLVIRNLKHEDYNIGYAITQDQSFLSNNFRRHINNVFTPTSGSEAMKNAQTQLAKLPTSEQRDLSLIASIGNKNYRYASFSHRYLAIDLHEQKIPTMFNGASRYSYNGQHILDNRPPLLREIIEEYNGGRHKSINAKTRAGTYVSNMFTYETATRHAKEIKAEIYIQSASNNLIAGNKLASKPFHESLTGIYNQKHNNVIGIPLFSKDFAMSNLYNAQRTSPLVVPDIFIGGDEFIYDPDYDAEDMAYIRTAELEWISEVGLLTLSNPISAEDLSEKIRKYKAYITKKYEDLFINSHMNQSPSLTVNDLGL